MPSEISVSARLFTKHTVNIYQLSLQAEGVPSEFSVPVFIDLAPNGNDVLSQNFPITLPDDVIDGSLRTRVKVTGGLHNSGSRLCLLPAGLPLILPV